MRARRRLLFVSPLPPPTGGISIWMVAMRDGPLADDYEIRVVDSSPSAAHVASTSRLRLGRVVDALRILWEVAVELVRFRPEIVHVNTSYAWAFFRDGIAVHLARMAGARTVLHVHGGDFPEWSERTSAPTRAFVRATLRRLDRVIAITEPTQRWLEREIDPARVRYLANFVHLDAIGPPPDRSDRSGKPVNVLFVGWMIEAKGVRELLAAAAHLPDARFTLVGPPEPRFTETVEAELHALRDHLRVLPVQPRDEIYRLYREADIFVLPTWREGFPIVVIEAMAAGLPVVSTPVGAIPEAVEDGRSGILVPVRDAASLESALRRLIGDAPLRLAMGRAGRARVESTFSFDAVAARLAALYRDLEA